MRILWFLLLVISQCTSPPSTREGSGVLLPQSVDPALGKRAEEFNRYVTGVLSPEERSTLKNSCRGGANENPFCYSLMRSEVLDKRIRLRTAIYKPKPQKPITPLAEKKSGGKIVNWTSMRKGSVKALLSGVSGSSLPELRVLAKKALHENRCPNNVAVAVAAALEDSLSTGEVPSEITELYQKAARCARRSPYDQENFLTRAGLIATLSNDKKKAKLFFSNAVAVKNALPSRSLYWLCRTQQELGEAEAAKKSCYRVIAQFPLSFHALLAQSMANQDPLGPFFKPGINSLKRSRLSTNLNHFIEQAEILRALGYGMSADLLIDWGIDEARDIEPEARLYLAELAEPRSQVSIVNDLFSQGSQFISRQTLGLYFPNGFYPLFDKHAAGLDPYLILAVARQESVFNPLAVSPGNAKGLLQILPDTGAKIAGNSDIDLLDSETNARLGALYLRELIGQMPNHHAFLAFAAYNAGAEKVQNWVRRFPIADPVLFIDLIPFRETRNYVANVLRNYYWYRRIHRDGARSVGKIADRDEILALKS